MDYPISKDRSWRVTGHVIDIDKEKNLICIWVRGFGNGEAAWIPILSEMPGWLLEPRVSFEADIPFEDRYQQELKEMSLKNFIPLEFEHLSDEELFDLIAKQMLSFEEISSLEVESEALRDTEKELQEVYRQFVNAVSDIQLSKSSKSVAIVNVLNKLKAEESNQ